MGTKRSEVQVLLAKKESTYGSDASAGASNAIAIMEPVFPEFDTQLIERGHPQGNLSRIKPLVGARKSKIAFKTEFYGSGAIDTAPQIGALLQACGLLETVNASTSVVYTAADASLVGNSIYFYLDGLLYKMLGSVGNAKISGKMGEPVMFEFEMTGLYQDDADSAIVTPSFGSNFQSPPQALGTTVTLDSETFIMREFNIDLGTPVIDRPSFAAGAGYAGFLVGKRNVTGNLIVEAETKATYDFLSKFEASTQVACTIGAIGGSTGNKITIDMNLTYTNIQLEDQDGLTVMNIPIALSLLSDSDREITITCT